MTQYKTCHLAGDKSLLITGRVQKPEEGWSSEDSLHWFIACCGTGVLLPARDHHSAGEDTLQGVRKHGSWVWSSHQIAVGLWANFYPLLSSHFLAYKCRSRIWQSLKSILALSVHVQWSSSAPPAIFHKVLPTCEAALIWLPLCFLPILGHFLLSYFTRQSMLFKADSS